MQREEEALYQEPPYIDYTEYCELPDEYGSYDDHIEADITSSSDTSDSSGDSSNKPGFAPTPKKAKRRRGRAVRKAKGPLDPASISREAIDRVRLGNQIIKQICDDTDNAQERREACRYALRAAGIQMSPRDIDNRVREAEEEYLREGQASGFIGATGDTITVKPEQYLIEDIIKEGQLNLLAGTTGVGKTTILLEMLRALLKGEDKFLGCKVNPFEGRHIIYVGVDNIQSFFVEKFGDFGLGSCAPDLAPGNIHYTPHPFLDFDSNDGVFRFTSEGMAKFEDRYLKRAGKPVERPLIILDSASTILSMQGIEEKSDLITGLLVDFTRLCQRYDATMLACFHMPKNVTMFDVGAAAIRGHGGPPQVAGQVITLSLVDDEVANQKQVRNVNLRVIYIGHRGKVQHLVARSHYEEHRTEIIGDFYELHSTGKLRDLITKERGGGPKEHTPAEVLKFAVGCLKGSNAEIFKHLASIDVVPNTEADYEERPESELIAIEHGYRSCAQIATELGIPVRTVQSAMHDGKPLTKQRGPAEGRSLVDTVDIPTGKRPLRMYRAYSITDLINGDY